MVRLTFEGTSWKELRRAKSTKPTSSRDPARCLPHSNSLTLGSSARRAQLIVFFLLFPITLTVLGQKAPNWRVYRASDGLAEAACLSVTLGTHGKILARHVTQPSISYLDGYTVSRIPAPESNAARVYESPAGQLWVAGYRGLFEFRDQSWVLHPITEISSRFSTNPQRPILMPIRPVRQGLVLFLLPEALMAYNGKDPSQTKVDVLKSAAETRLGSFLTFCLARDSGLWIAGSNGLAKVPGPARNLTADAQWLECIPPERLGFVRFQDPVEYDDGTVTALAEHASTGQKVIVQFDGQTWTGETPALEKIRFAWRTPTRSFWAVTQTSVYQWETGAQELLESEEVSAREFYDVAVEPSGTFWLATSDGLYRYAPPAWRPPRGLQRLNAVVHCITADRSDRIWFVAANGLHSLQNEVHREYPLPASMTRPQPAPQSINYLKDSSLLLEAGGKLFVFQPDKAEFKAVGDPAGNYKVLGAWKDGSVCVQHRSPAKAGGVALEVFTGDASPESLPNPPSEPGLGTNYLSFYAAQNGDLWFGTENGTAWYHEDKWRAFFSYDQSFPEGVQAFAELSDGKIWCAAQDRIWEFDGRSWTEMPRIFDRINGLVHSRDGSVWVASNTGCYRNSQGTWVENGVEEGLPAPGTRDVFEDGRGRIWAATTQGLSVFHPEADTDPPKAYIQEPHENAKDLQEGSVVNLTFTGVDKWKFTPRERLLYSFRLDQREWSEFAEITHVTFSDLAAGKHYLQVRAMDRNCNVDNSRPARFEFAIVLPWYKETRLVLVLSAAAGVALFFAALAFNRHWRLVRSYAEVEKKVAERTRELEIANRELLHSQKMTALGTLAAGIAHDFNNILSIVKGSAQLIEQNMNDPGKVRTRVDRIKTVVDQGAGIVKAMLGFSRDSGQQNGTLDVNEVVEDTVRLLGDRFLREVRVVSQPALGLPPISASKDLVQQILLNFIFNAAEAMSGRKEIFIATRGLESLPAEIVLPPARAGSYVEISVRDTGCGIPPEILPRIFEPFFTTKALSARRGTGLGLSMVYELARKLDAGLAVETVVNQGSVFSLILPVTESVTNKPSVIDETPDNPGH